MGVMRGREGDACKDSKAIGGGAAMFKVGAWFNFGSGVTTHAGINLDSCHT